MHGASSGLSVDVYFLPSQASIPGWILPTINTTKSLFRQICRVNKHHTAKIAVFFLSLRDGHRLSSLYRKTKPSTQALFLLVRGCMLSGLAVIRSHLLCDASQVVFGGMGRKVYLRLFTRLLAASPLMFDCHISSNLPRVWECL